MVAALQLVAALQAHWLWAQVLAPEERREVEERQFQGQIHFASLVELLAVQIIQTQGLGQIGSHQEVNQADQVMASHQVVPSKVASQVPCQVVPHLEAFHQGASDQGASLEAEVIVEEAASHRGLVVVATSGVDLAVASQMIAAVVTADQLLVRVTEGAAYLEDSADEGQVMAHWDH